MSSPNQPQSAPASGPAIDTRQGRGSKDKSGGGAISGALKKITSKLAWVMAGIIFAGIFFWGVAEIALNGPEPSVPFAGLTGHFSFDRFLLLGGILCLIPPTIVYLFESKKRDAIDNNIPHLIRDIADAGRSGMTLTRAIEISAERDYGPLTKEIKKLIAKISLPLPKITAVFLYMAMIEALFAGLVGGKMATGYLKDGLKHAILLMLICFITFVFFV